MQSVSIPIFLVFALALGDSHAVQQYCSEDTRLVTDYVTTTYEETRPVQGCVSTERSLHHGYDHVIVIRTNTSSSTNVLLTVTGKSYSNISNS